MSDDRPAMRRVTAHLLALLAATACTGEVIGGGVDDAGVAADGAGPGATDAAGADAAPLPPADATSIPDATGPPDPHVCTPAEPQDCSPGTGTGGAEQCFDGPSCYLDAVQAAVTDTIAVHPEWFSYDNPIGCPMILDVDAFLDAVVSHLGANGLCAIRDPNAPGEEVTVKHDNSFSENFDIVASTGCARYGDLIYTGYCAPAWW